MSKIALANRCSTDFQTHPSVASRPADLGASAMRQVWKSRLLARTLSCHDPARCGLSLSLLGVP